ncbi:unnamed protein product [Polarella glacialis]|uniref:phosphatidyl-N-methylethanolamine N-methyltransferase n=1 Tax=Polarella glacialis TaxID=89957 RepID=A0A813JYA2_POLGL|nr:unnamed protein product [Polarella glacialis]
MGGLDLILVGAGCIPAILRARQLGVVEQCASNGCLTSSSWWACIAGIAANYVMHGLIWNYPSGFANACRKQPLRSLGSGPVDVFASLEVPAKLVQGGSLLCFLGPVGRAAALSAITSAPMWCWAAFGALVAAGQALNFATYNAIGNAGVYYGFKFGVTVPWCYGFPFNSGLRHPQYTGVVLTLCGALPVLLSDETARKGLPQAIVAWAAMYSLMSAMEQAGDNDEKS